MNVSADTPLSRFFPGESALSAAMRAYDWAATPMGPPHLWPQALRTAIRILLTSRFEMWLGWGEDLAFFYNDSYVPTLGVKHPDALGRPVREVWPEIYDDLKDRFQSVMRDGVATWDRALLLLLERSGYPEETYHTFSYSPVLGDDGAIQGLLCIVTEETQRVISERRMQTLSALAVALVPVRTYCEIETAVDAAFAAHQRDFPFAFLKLFRAGPDAAVERAVPEAVAHANWPFEAIQSGAASVRLPLRGVLDTPPKGGWDVAASEALIVPIVGRMSGGPSGALVLGVNPYRRYDEETLAFAQLLAGQIAGALVSVDASVAEAAETERLRQLFEQSPSFTAVLRGPEHRYELINPAYAQLIAHRDVIGKTVREAIPEVEGQGFFELLDQVYASGEPFVGEAAPISIQRTPDAAPETRLLDFVYQPIRGADGAVTGIFVEGIDVTMARQAAVALRESEAKFRSFAEAIPNHIWTSTPDGQLDWFNDRVYEYSGARPGTLDGAGWADIVHPEDFPDSAQRWAEALASGKTYETEMRIRRADGAYRWHLVRAVSIISDDDRIVRWIGANTDIEDQKRNADALRRLNETLEQQVAERTADRNRIWLLSTDIMLVAKFDGSIAAVNPAATSVLGWSDLELVGRNWLDLVHPDDIDDLARAIRGGSEGSRISRFDSRILCRDGGFRWISWAAVPGESLINAVGRDVTAEREQAEALRLTEQQLRQSQKMEAVGQLTGGVAHDFNNLLHVISGNLELLKRDIAGNERAERRAANATAAVSRGAKLASQLLAFGRRQPLEPKVINIARIVSGMDEILRRALGEAVEIETSVAGGLWNCLVDPTQIENAVLNLAINARDAMAGAGKLTIEVSNAFVDDAYARLNAEVAPGQYVLLAVTDTGHGMSPEVLAQAFEPFFSTKPEGKGTGLGLSMVYGFVKQSGGSVKIYSEVGHGTTVKIYLPRVRQGEDIVAEVDARHVSGGTEVVLVVEDDEGVRATVIEMLTDLGYRVLTAKDATSALSIIESGVPIDLLFTDVVMPGPLKTTELARQARQRQPNIAVLFTSGYTENAIVHGGRLDEGVELLGKPYTREALAWKVRHVLSGRRGGKA